MKRFKNLSHVSLFKVLPSLLMWLRINYLSGTWATTQYLPLIMYLEKIRTNRGMKSAVRQAKLIRTAFLNHLAGTPVFYRDIKQRKDGLPSLLIGLAPKGKDDWSSDNLRLITTILFSTRALRLGNLPDIEPIISPPLRESADIGKYTRDFWYELGYGRTPSRPQSLSFSSFTLSTKSGPNGPGNATWNWFSDLRCMSSELNSAITYIGGMKLTNFMRAKRFAIPFILKKFSSYFKLDEGLRTRRISWFPDKELKVRVIGIADYYTQQALRPLHKYLFRVLKKIPQDCTFNQRSFKEKIVGWDHFSSIDLSNATDRFPISTICSLLEARLPKEYVLNWKYLMVGEPFDYQGKMISYSVGNPMGLYSSWSSFTVTHHYVMYYCCRELGINWSTSKYCLLGDDILIGDKLLSSKYKEVITSLGVNFAPEKSYESPHLLEFAKRLMYKNDEISPFPLSGLNEVTKRFYLFVNFIYETENKGWTPKLGAPEVVGSYYRLVKSLPSRFYNDMVKKSLVAYSVLKSIREPLTAGENISSAMKVFGYSFKLSNFVALNVLENIAVDLFAQKNPFSDEESIESYKKRLIPPIYNSDAIDNPGPGIFLLQSNPLFHIYRDYKYVIDDFLKSNTEYSQTGKWPLLLRAIVLPKDHNIYRLRHNHQVAMASSLFSKELEQRAEVLTYYPPEELLRETPDG